MCADRSRLGVGTNGEYAYVCVLYVHVFVRLCLRVKLRLCVPLRVFLYVCVPVSVYPRGVAVTSTRGPLHTHTHTSRRVRSSTRTPPGTDSALPRAYPSAAAFSSRSAGHPCASRVCERLDRAPCHRNFVYRRVCARLVVFEFLHHQRKIPSVRTYAKT